MTAFASVASLLLLSVLHSSTATTPRNPMEELDLPSGQDWTSLSKTVQFMPTSDQDSPLLRKAQMRLLNYYKDDFVDGLETQYNEYAQSWRLLGFFTDCDAVAEADQRRRLDEEGDDQAEEGDDQAEEGDDQAEEGDDQAEEEQAQEEDDGKFCKRYLLWAAYVDLDYEGNGLSEYMIYDSKSHSWDNSACKTTDGNRCVKMDCHLQGTNYKPLGFFRQDNPVEFLEILAQHQGSCSFSDGEANAMVDGAEWLPQQCTQTETMVGSTYLYFDLKPKRGGGLDVALYTDAKCSMEYTGSDETVDNVLASYVGYDVSLQQNLQYLNQALDEFKVCSPCRTYDLSYEAAAAEDDADAEDEENNGDPNNNNFVCEDNAGYAGVNQCMMFAQNTEIRKASFREITLASQQGTITRTYGAADGAESWWEAWGFLLISLCVLFLGLLCFCSVAVKRKRISSVSKNQPLISRR